MGAFSRGTYMLIAMVIAFGAGHALASSRANRNMQLIIAASKQGVEQISYRNNVELRRLEDRFRDQEDAYQANLQQSAGLARNIIAYLSHRISSLEAGCDQGQRPPPQADSLENPDLLETTFLTTTMEIKT